MILNSSILSEELVRLEQLTGIKSRFTLVWMPKIDSKKEGEVIGSIIYVYSCNLADAIHTLQHEFFDVMISRTNKPYVDMINTLLSLISDRIYQEKEEIVETLVRLARYHASAKHNPAIV